MSSSDPRVAELEARVAELEARLAATAVRPAEDDAVFLAAVLAAAPMFVMRLDPERRIRYINRILPGISPEQVYGAPHQTFIEPALRDEQDAVVRRVQATGVGETIETRGEGPGGSVSWYESHILPLDQPDGRRGILILALDVTRARQRERALLDSEARLQLALDASGVGLWSWDAATGTTTWDDRMRAICGRDEPLDLPRYTAELVHPDDRAWLAAESAGTNAVGGAFHSSPHRIVRPDGEIRWVTTRGLIELGGDGAPVRIVGGNLDVTAQHAAEEHLRKAQRLDAVGRLTAGVAHNFNNILTVVTASLDLLLRKAGGEAGRLAGEARGAALRGAELVRQLMTFAGQRPQVTRRPRAPGELIVATAEICRRTFDRHIALETSIASDLPAVLCSETDVEQIVMNLLLNARDAVLEAGKPAAAIAIAVEPAAADGVEGVRIEIRDDGVGMAPEVLAHLFEPFFTTKPVGLGTGLGLATSYAIVRELGGTLTATSEPGRGSTFSIWLPAASEAAELAAPRPAATTPRATRLLVVDDEAAVRRAVSGLLESAGFVVEAVDSGVAALEALHRGPPAAAILLDRSMPGAPGDSFLPAIRAAAPGARIVLFTGQQVEPELVGRVDAVLYKPISADQLFGALDDLLGPAPRPAAAR